MPLLFHRNRNVATCVRSRGSDRATAQCEVRARACVCGHNSMMMFSIATPYKKAFDVSEDETWFSFLKTSYAFLFMQSRDLLLRFSPALDDGQICMYKRMLNVSLCLALV